MLAQLRRGDLIERLLIRGTEVEIDLLGGGQEHQQVGPELLREQRCRAILVDDSWHAHELASRVHRDRDPTATTRDDQVAGGQQRLYRLDSHDPRGLRARHDLAPAASRILDHPGAAGPGDLPRPPASVERTDRLGGLVERSVLGGHEHLGQDGRDAAGHALVCEGVADRLLEQITDASLGGCHVEVERVRRDLRRRLLAAHQLASDLGPIAMHHQHPVALADDRHERLGDPVSTPHLLAWRALLVPGHQRVAAHGHDGQPLPHGQVDIVMSGGRCLPHLSVR